MTSCDILELVAGTAETCPVCDGSAAHTVELDAWDERRALAAAPEPEPFVRRVR